jgi:rhomboid-like protein
MFLPGVNFTLDELLPFMILIDVAGLVLKWQVMDHAAHLAGAAFGYWYVTHGPKYWSDAQLAILDRRRKS